LRERKREELVLFLCLDFEVGIKRGSGGRKFDFDEVGSDLKDKL